YDEAFKDLDWLKVPAKVDGLEHGYQSYPCLFEPARVRAAVEARDVAELKSINETRNAWMDDLQKAGISTRPATHAVHMLSFYRQKYRLKPEDFPNAFAANDCSISLPLFHGMTDSERQYVISVVRGSRP
ncbi:MAG: aminotransferase DegT, partial [Betaproteobacteria bacterium]|nr:aminotransferase DegT [Betaproteobacteria bacterium]